MRIHLSFIFTLTLFFAKGQCVHCTNLDEAFKQPEIVTSIDLSNQTIGIITKDFNAFKNLKTLNLSYTSIQTFETGVYFPELTDLNCKSTNINPWKLKNIGEACPKLTTLNLSDCQLNFIAGGLELFETLEYLDLSSNQLQYLPDELQYLLQLKSIDLSGNQFSNYSNTLGYLWKLQEVKIHHNPKLNGSSILTTLQLNSNIKSLHLDGKMLLDKASGSILSKMQVSELVIYQLDSEFPASLQNAKSIKKITLTDCGGIMNIPGIQFPTSMKSLSLKNTAPPVNPNPLKNIDTLNVADLEIKNPNNFHNFKQLKVLDLSGASIPKSMIQGIKDQLVTTSVISSYIDEPQFKPKQIIPAEVKTIAIDANKSEIIALKSIQFEIPENAFKNQDGTIYNGKAIAEITELDNPITMALDATPMTFTANGKEEIFRSNGMFRFEVKDSLGNELEPNQDNQIMVTMINQSPEKNGDLFVFNESTNNWELSNENTLYINSDSIIRQQIDAINKMDVASLIRTNTIDRVFKIRVKTHRYDPTKLSFNSYMPYYGESAFQINYFRKNEVSKEFTKFKWVLDTVLDPKMTKLLKTIRVKTKEDFKSSLFKSATRRNRAAQIWNLNITPDLAHDNYRLSFNFRDTSISIPVSLDGSTNRNIQNKYEKFERLMKRAQIKDQKDLQQFEATKEKNINQKSILVRQQLINQALNSRTQPNNQQIRFGLSSFGLINCDFFLNTPPIEYTFLSNEVIDQNGNRFETPATTKVVLLDQNSYLETGSKKIPIYKNAIGIVILSATQIGVIRLFESLDNSIKRIKSYDISGKSPSEVNDIIINQP